jgi:small neutral amino acid transporter SnatA (MarC family)
MLFLSTFTTLLTINAATRIVGFFVAAIGVGLIFHGVMEAIQSYLVTRTP